MNRANTLAASAAHRNIARHGACTGQASSTAPTGTNAAASGTTFTIDFDFTSSTEQQVLAALQAGGYQLVGFKGAVGPNQLQVGVPAWFTVPFANMFGQTTISYQPQYAVFVSNQGDIAANTVIDYKTMSSPVGLGSSLTFTPTGAFNSGGVADVPSDSIGVANDRPATSPDLTVGLAGLVNTGSGPAVYLPFCAFNVPPQNSIIMKPLEQVLLLAAELDLVSGTVTANLAAPGCMFQFDSATPDYPLMVEPGTFALASDGGPAVTPVPSGSSVAIVNGLSAKSLSRTDRQY